MKIHEYQGKEILRSFGVPVPRGIPAFTEQEAVEAAQKLGGPVWVVKAQIHAGGRGKGGGVKLARSVDEVKQLAGQMLGMQLKTHQTGPEGQKVRRLYIEEGADIQKEYYVSVVTDRATQKVAFIASSEGGMDIEEVAHSHPEKIIKVFVDPLKGLTDAQAKELADGIGIPADSTAQAADVFKKLYKCYMDTDASLVEINPLNRDGKGNIIALDAKFNFDSNALFRQPEIVAGTWKAARAHADDITEADARAALQQLDPLWDELFPAEQARIVALLVERVDIGTDGLNVRLRMDGLGGLAREMLASGIKAVA